MIYFALLLFFLFDYLRPGSYVPSLDVLRLNALLPIVCIIGTMVTRTAVSNRQFFSEANTKIFAVFLGLLVVSTMFATLTMTAYETTKTVFSYLLIYWVLVRQANDVRRLKGVFISLIIVHLAIAGLNPALFTSPDSRVGINSGAFLGDGNDFALSVNICVPLCLFLLFESKTRLQKAVWGGALLVLVLCVVATKSRGGTVALGSTALYFWWRSRRKLLTASLFVLTAAVVVAWAPASYFDRMSMIADSQESSAQGRIMAWKAAVQMAVANPFLGAGAGHFPMVYGTMYRVEGTPWLTAHSVYFLVLGELGLPGFAVLLTFIFSNLAANRRLSADLRRLSSDRASTAGSLLACSSAALVAFATGGAFLSVAYYPHIYVLAGVLVTARHVARVQLEVREPCSDDQANLGARAPRLRLSSDVVSAEWRSRKALVTNHLR